VQFINPFEISGVANEAWFKELLRVTLAIDLNTI
jgi:hypothetical protein